jgi:hypothetical protein
LGELLTQSLVLLGQFPVAGIGEFQAADQRGIAAGANLLYETRASTHVITKYVPELVHRLLKSVPHRSSRVVSDDETVMQNE